MSLHRTDLKIRIVLLTVAGALAAAPVASAEEESAVVPPDNSAVNQYTETYPTGGGGRDVHKDDKNDASPKQVLGNRNAKRLEQEGPTGRAAAEVAAETAPAVEKSPAEPEEPEDQAAAPPSGGGNGAGGGKADGSGRAQAPSQDAAQVRGGAASNVDVPEGSSGVSEVLAQATGSSSDGELGLLLPLVILAAIGWAIALLVRRPGRAAQ